LIHFLAHMSCPVVLVSGKRKNQPCHQPIVKGGTTCSLHKKKGIVSFSKEQIAKIKDMAEQGEYDVDQFKIDRNPSESKEETFCKWYRSIEPNRSIKIIEGQVYLSEPYVSVEVENETNRFTTTLCRSLLKTLDADTLVQFKSDMQGMDPVDMKPLFLHYQFPMSFQWDTKLVYSCFTKCINM
jgi:hypothetical protein